MKNEKVKWAEFDDGFIGILPCAVVTIFIDKGVYGLYSVRVANHVSGHVFANVEDAKTEGVIVAKRMLTDCLMALDV